MPLFKLSPLYSEPLSFFGSVVPFLKSSLRFYSSYYNFLTFFSQLGFDIDSVPDILPCFPQLEFSLLAESMSAYFAYLIFAVDDQHRLLVHQSLVFDASLFEILGCCAGCVLLPKTQRFCKPEAIDSIVTAANHSHDEVAPPLLLVCRPDLIEAEVEVAPLDHTGHEGREFPLDFGSFAPAFEHCTLLGPNVESVLPID